MFYTFATQECVYNNLYRCIVTGRWWRNIQQSGGRYDSAALRIKDWCLKSIDGVFSLYDGRTSRFSYTS